MIEDIFRRQFSQHDVNELFNQIPTRTLLAIAKEDVVEWTDEYKDMRGKHRIYGLANLYQIAVVTHLALTGLSYSSIKEMVVDPYLKGKDSKGRANILNYMNKLLGIKIGSVKVTESLSDYAKQHLSRSVIRKKTQIARRMPLYNVYFDVPENIDAFIKRMLEPFEPPKEKIFFRNRRSQLQPITIMIIDLREIADRLYDEIEYFLSRSKLTTR